MLHTANIVPQIGNAGSKSGGGTVSYQITRGSQSRALVGLHSDAKSSRITAQSSSSREASL